ncbi:peptide-methionine (S)-S-oxide reductase MsrA [bacterium]|nr:peptide-methionine (S)-S-oxide reductase MsrA [bacterium]
MRQLKSEILSVFCATLLVACSIGENKSQTLNQDEEVTMEMEGSIDTATFGAGCFWCVEAVFQEVEGVVSVKSGYAGGFVKNPSYKEVCKGQTGHAEVAQLVFDTTKVSFEELLDIFWKTHDPTTLNRQGNDVGTQYRSVVFYHNQDQKEKAEFYKTRINDSKAYPADIVTTIEKFDNYSEAEENHQDYYSNNGSQPYCTYVIQPKVEKFRKAFADKLKK